MAVLPYLWHVHRLPRHILSGAQTQGDDEPAVDSLQLRLQQLKEHMSRQQAEVNRIEFLLQKQAE